MSDMKKITLPVVIIGAGITGLWLLNRLHQKGIRAVILENKGIGAGQTGAAQGIIHGGAKYALTGKAGAASKAVAEATRLWADCLSGQGVIDLRALRLLSPAHYLWSRGRLSGGLKNFIASKMLNSESENLPTARYPKILQHPDFRGNLCELHETVIDVPSLLQILAQPYRDKIWQAKGAQYHYDQTGALQTVELPGLILHADQYILTAGEGNEAILPPHFQAPKMQRRPLHMVWVNFKKSRPELTLYVHCTGLTAVPRLTITTHTTPLGHTVWYLGGGLAENGVTRDQAKQIAQAKAELQDLLPWVDVRDAHFDSAVIQRAEIDNHGKRPDHFSIERFQNMWACWPTKLTLAPVLAEALLQKLTVSSQPCDPLPARQSADFAPPLWAQSG